MNSVVRARIDDKIKNEAADVLAAIGLTPSDAFRMLMIRVAKEKKLPFAPLEPNKVTRKAIAEARVGRLRRFKTVDDLMADLNERD